MTRIVRGFVNDENGAYAVYLVRWAPGRPQHDATIAVSIGGWGGDESTPRRLVVLSHRILESGPGFMIVNAAESPWVADGFLGSPVSRDEALASPLAAQVFAILDAADEQDSRLNHWRLA